jgi:hypothetical protein
MARGAKDYVERLIACCATAVALCRNPFPKLYRVSSYLSICRTPRHPLSPCSPLPPAECTLLYEALDAVAFLYTYFIGFLISFIRTWSIGVTFAAGKGSSDE